MNEAELEEYLRDNLKIVVRDDYDPESNTTNFEIKLMLKNVEISRDSIYIRN